MNRRFHLRFSKHIAEGNYWMSFGNGAICIL